MSDLTWTEMPEVDPEQPDELVLDFSGEIHRVAPADTFVIGRGGDLDIDDNPTSTAVSWSSPTPRTSGGSPMRARGCRPP